MKIKAIKVWAAIPMLFAVSVAFSQVPELDRAQQQLKDNHPAEAAATLDAYLALHPGSAPGWARRGIVASQMKDDRSALADFDRAEKNGMPASVLNYRRAHAYAALGDKEKALEQLEAAATAGVAMTVQLADGAFDSMRTEKRFVAVVALNEVLLHPCVDDAHRSFDFWVGDWSVTNKAGVKVGDSSIKRILNDCVVLESWTGLGGGSGQSFNHYEPLTKTWTQFWVDVTGTGLMYTNGVYREGAMRFSGHNPGPKGEPIEQRFSFFNLDRDHVRQFQEQTVDQGKTWTTVYDFYYARKSI